MFMMMIKYRNALCLIKHTHTHTYGRMFTLYIIKATLVGLAIENCKEGNLFTETNTTSNVRIT